MELLSNLEKLSGLSGVSGAEDAVREEILAQLEGLCDDCKVDPLGNVLVFKKGAKRAESRVLLSAHMDEVGLIITHIDESGLLRFATVGGIDDRVIVGKSVEIGFKRIYGVIGTKAIHQQEEKERESPVKVDKLYIDIGAENAQQAAEYVQLGDRAIFHSRFQKLGGNKLMGRAFDDRAGCALLLEILRKPLPYDCHFAFTVQEESGCTGGKTAGYTVDPDISIVVETTTASDIAGVEPDKVVCRLGQGPVVSFMDRGTIYDRGLYELALQVAKENEIPCQSKAGIFGGNESRSIQVARGGARVLAVSLPCRYLHTPSTVLQADDLFSTLELLEKLIPATATLSEKSTC